MLYFLLSKFFKNAYPVDTADVKIEISIIIPKILLILFPNPLIAAITGISIFCILLMLNNKKKIICPSKNINIKHNKLIIMFWFVFRTYFFKLIKTGIKIILLYPQYVSAPHNQLFCSKLVFAPIARWNICIIVYNS